MPYSSGKRKGELNRCDAKKLWIEKTGESPPVSWNRDKIMTEIASKYQVDLVPAKEPEIIEEVNHVMETVESVEVIDETVPKKKTKTKKNKNKL